MVMALTLKHASEQEFRRRPDGDVPPWAGGRPHDSLCGEVDGGDGASERKASSDSTRSCEARPHGHSRSFEEFPPVVPAAESLVGEKVAKRRRTPLNDAVCDTWEVSPGKDLVERRCRSRHRGSSAQAPRPAPDVSAGHGSGVRQPIRRRRFTIAHELGHWVCQYREGTLKLFYCRPGDVAAAADRGAEREANVFAAELLMPEPAVRAEFNRAASAAELAGWFGVSEEAIGWRIYNLGLMADAPRS